LWNTATGKEVAVLAGHEGPVADIAFNPNGTQVATASSDRTTRLWNVSTRPSYETVLAAPGHHVQSARWSEDGKAVITTSDAPRVQLWEAATGKRLTALDQQQVAAGLTAAALNRDGSLVLVRGGGLRLFRASTGQECGALTELPGAVSLAAWDSAGRRILALHGNTLCVWDAATQRPVQRWTERTIETACWAGDAQVWGIESAQGKLVARLWDAATGREVRSIALDVDNWKELSFSADARRLLVAYEPVNASSGERALQVWDLETGRKLRNPSMSGAPVHMAVLSHDGAKLATACSDRQVRLYDLQQGKELAELTPQAAEITHVEFSRDGRWLVTAAGSEARIWSAADGREWLTLHGPRSSVSSAAFSPDSRFVLTTAADGTARVWPVDPLPLAEARRPRELTEAERKRFGVAANDKSIAAH
jgi:WD40 repeat protein